MNETTIDLAHHLLGCKVHRQPTWADGTPGLSWCRVHREARQEHGNNWHCPEAAAIVPLLAEWEARVRADECEKIAECIGLGKSVMRSIDKRIVMHNKHADALRARAES